MRSMLPLKTRPNIAVSFCTKVFSSTMLGLDLFSQNPLFIIVTLSALAEVTPTCFQGLWCRDEDFPANLFGFQNLFVFLQQVSPIRC